MDRVYKFVQKILFIYTVFILYWGGTQGESGAALLPAQKSPGWNGWCRQRLNPRRAHCVTSTNTPNYWVRHRQVAPEYDGYTLAGNRRR